MTNIQLAYLLIVVMPYDDKAVVFTVHCWSVVQKLVVKPDQLIKRRGKLGLIKVNASLDEVKSWVNERIGKDFQVKFILCLETGLNCGDNISYSSLTHSCPGMGTVCWEWVPLCSIVVILETCIVDWMHFWWQRLISSSCWFLQFELGMDGVWITFLCFCYNLGLLVLQIHVYVGKFHFSLQKPCALD
jgi:hypothetical protein